MRVSSGAEAKVKTCPSADPPLSIPTLRTNVLDHRRAKRDCGTLTNAPPHCLRLANVDIAVPVSCFFVSSKESQVVQLWPNALLVQFSVGRLRCGMDASVA